MRTISDGVRIPDTVREDICRFARKNGIQKVVLFGSRARGTNGARSDIDLAVTGESALDFYYDLEEESRTLLMFDVVNLDKDVSQGLREEIERDGLVLYEKV